MRSTHSAWCRWASARSTATVATPVPGRRTTELSFPACWWDATSASARVVFVSGWEAQSRSAWVQFVLLADYNRDAARATCICSTALRMVTFPRTGDLHIRVAQFPPMEAPDGC